MRRTILPQAIVVAIDALAPTGVGVVARLIRQYRRVVVAQVDFAVVIRPFPFPIHDRETSAAREHTA
jgi:hypothetical protein